MHRGTTGLPRELADRIARPFARFLEIEAAIGSVLLVAIFSAVALANSGLSASFLDLWETSVGVHLGSWDFARSLRRWINDGLMTMFLFVIALELKRELMLGELRDLRMTALAFAGALGGMVVPAGLFLLLTSGHAGSHGWGTVMATDTAFVIGSLALLGSRIPTGLRLLLLSLAIFDDVGAILVVAIGYGEGLNPVALALALLSLALVDAARRIGVRSVTVFFAIGGAAWLCFDASGLHPTIAGVILGLMTPARAWVSDERLRAILDRLLSYPRGDHWAGDTKPRRDLRRAGTAVSEALSPVERLELMLHPWVGFVVMPLFALANAGVAISAADVDERVFSAIVVGLVLGKPAGVVTFCWLAVRLGLARRAPGVSWSLLAAGSLLTGIAFTMSLFIADMAFQGTILDTAKTAVLAASTIAAGVGLLALACLTAGRRAA
jgi:NhaA family Na+:H+ antiporter